MAAAAGVALLLAGAGGSTKFNNLKLASYVTLKNDVVPGADGVKMVYFF